MSSGSRLYALAVSSGALPVAAAAAGLAIYTTRAVLEQTGGEPTAPLDDAYIHFQYARAFAEARPFEYTPGAEPTAGTTSLLWPLVLAPFLAFGLGGTSIVWVAWAFGWVSLALLGHETRNLAARLASPLVAWGAAAMVLTFGGFVWFAGSCMEVVPLAAALTRTARRSAEWVEADAPAAPSPTEIVVLAFLAPLLRPEGVVATVLAVAALTLRRPAGRWRDAAIAALGVVAPALVVLAATGEALTTTARAKWLAFNPYYPGVDLVWAVAANVRLFFATLLDGELWTSVFIPEGGRTVAWAALAAIPIATVRRRLWFRGAAISLLALCILIPTTYETFLVNRVRYIWPFASAWLIGLALLSEQIGDALARARGDLRHLKLVVTGCFVGLFASKLGWSVEDLATSADAVRLQQVALGRWAKTELSEDSRLGVNDTGAIAYFGERTTFDIVGLTTRGEARYWTAGAGSRFEHYERLTPGKLPTHFVVYPEWMAIEPLLGERLAQRTVHATILGGATMSAHVARYEALGSGARPESSEAHDAIDVLDVADLESEAVHDYALLHASQAQNRAFTRGAAVDGGRAERERDEFRLEVVPAGRVIMRVAVDERTTLRLTVDERTSSTSAEADDWVEVQFEVPGDVSPGRQPIVVSADAPFTSLHYWSYD